MARWCSPPWRRVTPHVPFVVQIRTMKMPQSGHPPRSHLGVSPNSDVQVNPDSAKPSDPDAPLKHLMSQSGLVPTEARLLVLRILRASEARHMSTERLCSALIKRDFAPGISTFRTAIYDLNLAGALTRVLVPLSSIRMQTLYEIADKSRHRHLFCTECKKILEICDEAMERRIAHQFALSGLTQVHFDLARRGTCQACATAKPASG